MQEAIDKAYVYLVQYGLNIIAAIFIFIIGKWVARLVSQLCEKALVKSKVEKTLATFAKNIIYFGILAFVAIAALNKLGVETNSFLAIIGAAGLAVGLALQGSLSNFAAGVMMVLFQPFRVDDYIEAGGAEGIVHEIQIFSTIIITKDKKRVIVPNAKITGDKITVHPKAG
ncbi:MAG TPA: mechanosensitive ion channel [Candidatus Omnitrophota bacterium]|nr:mechanosensitive ion channel [Candidatus Omnitrophota bacterium]HPD84673.1 mechanosensitive ion channel [Candidatus Omnitrophota bacterium]HRZ03531.1 mechanosensitive ion channel [Candidatus Omnitrophota bacterium]